MAIPVSQQKIAEKLTILNDRAIGITTRIYNIKKACSDPKSKPEFLSDKSLEGSLKYIVKKFPVIDVKSGAGSVQAVNNIRQKVTQSLSLYYFTFVDLLDFKDHVSEALTTIDACQLQLDLTLNYDLTAMYLQLIVRYISLMILLSRVDDRKAVLGLYSAAYELQHGQNEPNFPRLGQMILDFDPPLKKLSEEFTTHSRVLIGALASIATVYCRRNLSADQWRSAQMLSLTASSQQLLYAAQTDTLPCEYLSVEEMDRWIIFGLAVSYQNLGQPLMEKLWPLALQNSLTTQLFRDEVIMTHQYIQTYFETMKGLNKRVADIKDYYSAALQNACHLHRERRKFLRTALKELVLLLSDQPGLLGPKVLFVWMGLSFARDEVIWLARHAENWPQKAQSKGKAPDDLSDRQLPELLFLMEELRGLVTKYGQVIQRYHVQYLSGYDAIAVNELIQAMGSCPEEESMILSSFCKDVAELTVEGLSNEDGIGYDFRGLRLDWCRLQSYMSCGRGGVLLSENRKLAFMLNQLVFHTKMVDWLDQMLIETADLHIYCFYQKQFEQAFTQCVEFPSQARYIAAFPQICTHFLNCLHEMCPEEKAHIAERSLSLCNSFLDETAKEAKEILTSIADQHCDLADKVLPKFCARKMNEDAILAQRKGDKDGKSRGNKGGQMVSTIELPGLESERRTREQMTTLDKLQVALTELCYAINYYPQIVVNDHSFAPREYLTQQLENRFIKCVVGMAMYDPTNQIIAKPSELLSSVRTYMSVLQSVENYINIDISRVFNNVLLQQTQAQDCYGNDTITALYTKWYLEVLLRRVSIGQILYSPHQMSFVVHPNVENPVHFNPQEYTDINEIKSLCDLLGPYGIKFMCERLMWHVASQVQELKKLVVQNKDLLRSMRSSFDKPDKMRDLYRILTASTAAGGNPKAPDAADSLLQRLSIIGEILCFKDLLQNGLNDLLVDKIPFLVSSVADFKRTFPIEHTEAIGVYEMCQAGGVECEVDALLVNAIKAQKQDEKPDDDYVYSCLLLVFIAVCLPKLAKSPSSFHKASVGANLNNSHCVAKAINQISAAVFTIHARGDLQDRMKEFLALASGSLLRMSQEVSETESQGAKESVYLLLEKIVEESDCLTSDLLESCFPYVLIRSAYHYCYTQELWQSA